MIVFGRSSNRHSKSAPCNSALCKEEHVLSVLSRMVATGLSIGNVAQATETPDRRIENEIDIDR